jgi:hypothetical protein
MTQPINQMSKRLVEPAHSMQFIGKLVRLAFGLGKLKQLAALANHNSAAFHGVMNLSLNPFGIGRIWIVMRRGHQVQPPAGIGRKPPCREFVASVAPSKRRARACEADNEMEGTQRLDVNSLP